MQNDFISTFFEVFWGESVDLGNLLCVSLFPNNPGESGKSVETYTRGLQLQCCNTVKSHVPHRSRAVTHHYITTAATRELPLLRRLSTKQFEFARIQNDKNDLKIKQSNPCQAWQSVNQPHPMQHALAQRKPGSTAVC